MVRRLAPVVFTIAATLAAIASTLLLLPRFGAFDLTFGDLVIRTQHGHRHPFPTAVAARATSARAPFDRGRRPRGVVLVIGDGMGIGQVTAASYLLHGSAGRLFLETAPVTGLVRTVAADRLVTDSAAAASAMATGYKVDYRALSIRPDGSRPTTLFEAAHSAGLTVGAVTTAALVDATPAAFMSHVPSRYAYGEILTQMLASGADVLIGGVGTEYPRVRRDPLYKRLLTDLPRTANGFNVARSLAEMRTTAPPLLALLPSRGPGIDQYGPPIAATGTLAYDLVAARPAGFVLLVECEATDGFGHANAIDELVAAVGEVDDAARALVGRAARTGDVLVIATADHDTGGLAIVADDGRSAEVRWASAEHTAQLVSLFAWGPGAEHFDGVLDNTEIATRIAALLGLAGLPAPASGLDFGANLVESADSNLD